MQITQTFLPIITNDNRILGMMPIPKTTFTGSETSVSLQNVATPIRFVSPSIANIVGLIQPVYVAISVTPTQERENFKSAVWLASFIPYSKWNNQLGLAQNLTLETTLIQLLRGVNLSGSSSPVTVVTASNGTADVNWATEVNMTGMNAFIEVNWMMLMQAKSGNISPAVILLGAMTADPSNGEVLAFVVQSDAPVVNEALLMNTIRFVKIAENPVPKGAYIWPATITNTDGSKTTATFTLNNV